MENLERGIEFFNKGGFFEAHEEWEKLWKQLGESSEKHFIQGMIMVAAALHHYKRLEYRGTEKLLAKAVKILKEHIDANVKIEKGDFLENVVSFYERFRFSVSAEKLPFFKIMPGREDQ